MNEFAVCCTHLLYLSTQDTNPCSCKFPLDASGDEPAVAQAETAPPAAATGEAVEGIALGVATASSPVRGSCMHQVHTKTHPLLIEMLPYVLPECLWANVCIGLVQWNV